MRTQIILRFSIFFALLTLLGSCTSTGRVEEIPALAQKWPYAQPQKLLEGAEAKAMIEKTIGFLEENNRTYWGNCSPAEQAQYRELLNRMADYIQLQSSSYIGVEEEWMQHLTRLREDSRSYTTRGEFNGALTDLAYYLEEGHSMVFPQTLLGNEYGIGAPLINFQESRHTRMGASLVVGQSNEILVSQIVEGHNLYSLSPGDRIVAVNGVPWEDWRIPLEESLLPVIGSPGGNPQARSIKWQKALMMNITLFQDFTVEKLDGSLEWFDIDKGVEPVPVPSYPVRIPQFGIDLQPSHKALQAGILKDSRIGYIHIDYFDHEVPQRGGLEKWDPGNTSFSREFYRLVKELQNTEGLILDLRGHSGGLWQVAFEGLSLLVKNPEEELFFKAYSYREGTLLPAPEFEKPFPEDHPDQSYTFPIVVLCDVDTVSGGDFFMALAAEYPSITVIGEAHNGSFLGVEKPRGFHAGDNWVYGVFPEYLWTGYDGSSLLRHNFLDARIAYSREELARGEDSYILRALEIIED